jgi:hypothetical protein
MKAREPRAQVFVPARMQSGSAWADVTILNISSRGLMMRTMSELKRGDYVEVRRGTLIIIARVAWVRDGYVGLRSQDRIDISAVVNEPRLLSRPRSAAAPDQVAERRHDPSRVAAEDIAKRMERSRAFGSAFQFIALSGTAVAAAFVLGGFVSHFLTGVSATIQAALAGG